MKRFLLAHVLVASCAFAQRVPWALETSPVASSQAGDPTFVFLPDPAPLGTRLVVGTDTAAPGVYLWDVQSLFVPTVLTTPLVTSADARGPLLVATSFATNSLLVFEVGTDGGVTQLNTGTFNVPSPRHVALRQTPAGSFEVYVDTSSQTIEHHELRIVDGGVTFALLPSMRVAEPPSGLAIDDRTGRLFVAQPTTGLMVIETDTRRSFLKSIDAGTLGSAVGGIDLFLSADGGALIVTTAPNEGELKVHSLTGTFLTTLQLTDLDGGTPLAQPRALDLFEQPVPGFPKGVLVVHDGLNANYKVFSLAAVDAVFPLPDPFIPAMIALDAGLPGDAGTPDAGPAPDGGMGDAGTGGGAGGGSGGAGGGTGVPTRPGPGLDPEPACGCTGSPFALLPALLALWCIRRRRLTP